jgi:1-acyl-sn-glycerol-3-phosphate acyltransferase
MPRDPLAPESLDMDLLQRLVPWMDRACRLWYRLDVQGMDQLPEGPALIVGNHNSGTSFYEALGVGARMYRERGDTEVMHGLAHDQVVDAPILGDLMVRLGTLRASHEAAQKAFALGRKLWVFPGGSNEAFRSWSRRKEVDLGGRRGFIKLALRSGVPIVPVAFHGGQSGFVVLREGRRIAKFIGADRWLRNDTWPLMLALPWGVALGPVPHLPLPVKCRARFMPPIFLDQYGPEDADNPEVLDEIFAQVQASLQAGVDTLGGPLADR